MSTVLNANRIIVIDKGEVLEEGTHSELLLKKGKYYQLVQENEANMDTQNEPTPGEADEVTKSTYFM